MTKISFIVVAYNAAQSLDALLGDLLSQTIAPEQLEALLVDSASTDDTAQIMRRFAARAPFEVRLLENPKRWLASGINVALFSIEPHSVVLRSIGQRCTDSIASHNIRNAASRSIASRSIASRGTSSIAFGGAKKRGNARWTNKRLVALDERDRIAPVHGLHAQAHRVISARLVVQNHLRAQRLAQRSHVSMARDHHAPAEQIIGCSHNMADQRRAAKLSHEFIAPETRSHARCHNDASVLQCAAVGSVWHSGIRLCKFDGWTG